MSNRPTIQKVIVVVALLLYVTSFFLTAFTFPYIGQLESMKGFETFVMGGLAILGGGLFEWFVWLANPLFFICLWRQLHENRYAVATGIGASVLAGSFLFWKEVLAAESGHMAPLASKNAGYFLWLTAILLCTATAIVLRGKERKGL